MKLFFTTLAMSMAMAVSAAELTPSNVKLQETDNGILMSWNAPETEIPSSEISYNIYSTSHEDHYLGTYIHGTKNELVATVIGDTQWETTIENPTKTRGISYFVEAVANGVAGEAVESQLFVTGKSLQLPIVEKFEDMEMNYNWFVDVQGEGLGFGLSALAYSGNGISCDGDDVSLLFFGCYSNDRQVMESQRINLSPASRPTLTFNLLPYSIGRGANFIVEVITPDGTASVLSNTEYVLNDAPPKDGTVVSLDDWWRTISLDLSEFANYDYIRLRFTADHKGKLSTGISMQEIYIDNIRVMDMINDDLGVYLYADSDCVKGYEANIKAQVFNNTTMISSPFKFTVYGNDKVIFEESVDEGLNGNETIAFEFSHLISVLVKESVYSLKAVVELEEDGNLENNEAQAEILLYDPDSEPVETLNVNGNVLSWTTVARPIEPFTEMFDDYEPWTYNEIGDWKAFTRSTGVTGPYFSDDQIEKGTGARYPLENIAGVGFMVADPKNWDGKGYDITTTNTNIAPKFGEKYLMATYNMDDNGSVEVADEWLISPELSGEQQTIVFAANNYYNGTMDMIEDFDILCSSDESRDNLDSYEEISSFRVTGGQWAKIDFNVPEGTKWFAVHRITTNAFMLILDRFTYRREATVDHFNIYRDDELFTTVPAGTFELSGIDAETHQYAVSVVYSSKYESMPKYTSISGIDTIWNDNISDRYETGRFDLMGRPVSKFFKGIVIVRYSDGSSAKKIQ